MKPRHVTCWFLFLLLGCGSAEEVLAPVAGEVRQGGRPLAGGTVVFTPNPERGGHGSQSWALIGPDGRFQLLTDGRPGAPAGWHRITIAPGPGNSLPSRYSDPVLSGLHFEIKCGGVNQCNLDLDLE